MNAARQDNVGRCTKCGQPEHWELLDAILDEDGEDCGRYEDIACYGEGWAPVSIDSIGLSVRPELKPHYDAWLAAQARRP